MKQESSDLVGRFFINYSRGGELEQGWIVKELSSGLFLVEFYIELAEKVETVLEVVHPVEMRGWYFYRNSDLAQKHYDELMVKAMEPIDLEPLLNGAADELVDTILEELHRARLMKKDARAAELKALLRQLTD